MLQAPGIRIQEPCAKSGANSFPRCLAKRTMRVFHAAESHYFCVGIFTCVQPSKELRRSRLANTDNGSTWRQDCLLQISPRREIPHTRAASSHRRIVQGERIRPTDIRQIRREDRTFLQLSFKQFPIVKLTVSSYGTQSFKVWNFFIPLEAIFPQSIKKRNDNKLLLGFQESKDNTLIGVRDVAFPFSPTANRKEKKSYTNKKHY